MQSEQQRSVAEEAPVHIAAPHWMVYREPVLLVVIGTIGFLSGHWIGAVLITIGAFVISTVRKAGLLITHHRLIIDRGWRRLSPLTLNLDAVDDVTVHQGLLGALFGYGTVVVTEKNGRRTVAPLVSAPEDVRAALISRIDAIVI